MSKYEFVNSYQLIQVKSFISNQIGNILIPLLRKVKYLSQVLPY